MAFFRVTMLSLCDDKRLISLPPLSVGAWIGAVQNGKIALKASDLSFTIDKDRAS